MLEGGKIEYGFNRMSSSIDLWRCKKVRIDLDLDYTKT